MTRRSFFVALAILLLLTGGGVGVVAGLVRYERDWYARATLAPGDQRAQLSKEFYSEFCELITAIAGEREWYARFTDEQINSYFEEDFVQSGLDARLLPEWISEPRVSFEPEKIRLAFRYGADPWSTVISLDLRIWLASGEPNVVALELQGIHAGRLPVSAQSLLERISEVCRANGMDVLWYRFNGHPVALLRFQADQPRTTLQLEELRVEQGSLTLRGRSGEAAPAPVQGPTPEG